MSRREFRVAVDLPRPLGAIVMVSTASTTLAVSGQIAGWVVALQALAIAATLLLRKRPLAWQRSAPILNLGMFATCVVGLQHYGEGRPAIVAFAHFAMLAQGLQLLDARPRRSEFLLVALALFQVVLASNLTDSVLFPVLLVVFLFATVWTLIVHTLTQEALEAGVRASAQRVATPALLRTALLASSGSILIALLLFIVLPRMRSSLVHAVAASSSAVSGFSDRVELGDIGRIRADDSRVLRIETLRGEAPEAHSAYWRGLAFDHFDGRTWSVGPTERQRVPGFPRAGLDLAPGDPPADLVQRIVREPTEAGVLFALGRPRALEGEMRGVERDANGNLFAARSAAARIDYTLRSRAQRAAAALAADVAAAPSGDAAPGRFLQLPPLGDEVRALALRITLGAESDAARAAALERHLRRVGRYSDTPPTLDPDDPRSPIEVFLSRGLAGHCEYFATAMAVLGRSVGLPTRLATGFAGGRVNTLGGFVELAHADAHAWVEIHFLRAGWVRYDPTPPDLRLRPDRAASFGERLLEIASAIEYWYFDRIVDFDRNDQIRGLTAGWRAWRRLHAQAARNRSDDPGSASWRDSLARLSRRHALVAIAALVALVLAVRRRPRSVRARAAGPYADALRLLARRRGLVRPPSHAPRAFARHVRAELPDEAGSVFAHLTESYLAERFGGRSGLHAAEQLQRLRRSLRAHSATR